MTQGFYKKIDDQIMELLDERYSLSIQIGKIKQETKSPVLDSLLRFINSDAPTLPESSPTFCKVSTGINNISAYALKYFLGNKNDSTYTHSGVCIP